MQPFVNLSTVLWIYAALPNRISLSSILLGNFAEVSSFSVFNFYLYQF